MELVHPPNQTDFQAANSKDVEYGTYQAGRGERCEEAGDTGDAACTRLHQCGGWHASQYASVHSSDT